MGLAAAGTRAVVAVVAVEGIDISTPINLLKVKILHFFYLNVNNDLRVI
jgi:hypothetical protein